MYICTYAQMVYRCVSKCADFQSDQILSHHGDVHTIAMALKARATLMNTVDGRRLWQAKLMARSVAVVDSSVAMSPQDRH